MNLCRVTPTIRFYSVNPTYSNLSINLIQPTSSSPAHLVLLLQSSSSQPHPVNRLYSTSSSPTRPVNLIQSIPPSQPHPVCPIQSTSFSQPHQVILSLFPRPIPTQTLGKEGRNEGRYRMAAAGEGELYVQYSILHWVLMRLHMSLKKDIGKRIRGIFAMDRTLDLTKEKCGQPQFDHQNTREER